MSSLPAPIAPPDIAFVTLCMGVRRRGVRAEHTDKVTAIPGSIQMGMEDMCSTSICAFAKHVDTAVHRTYSFVDDTTPARVLALYKHYRVRPVFPFRMVATPRLARGCRSRTLLGRSRTAGPNCLCGACGSTTLCFALTLM